LTSDPALKSYHLLPSVRGDLLAKLGRFEEARPEFERAASLTRNTRERDLLLGRAAASGRSSASPELAGPSSKGLLRALDGSTF
jgi:predicted RNA polymerase sigma factor